MPLSAELTSYKPSGLLLFSHFETNANKTDSKLDRTSDKVLNDSIFHFRCRLNWKQ